MVKLRLIRTRKFLRLIHSESNSRLFQLESFIFMLCQCAKEYWSISFTELLFQESSCSPIHKTYMLLVITLRALQLKWISGSECFIIQPCKARMDEDLFSSFVFNGFDIITILNNINFTIILYRINISHISYQLQDWRLILLYGIFER